MTENYVQLPTDASNTGKLVRTNQRVVGANTVEEHFMVLQDYTNDYQAKIGDAGHLWVAGSISSVPTTTVTATNLDIRDLSSLSDSVEIKGTGEIGSVVISSAPVLGVSGLKLDNLAGSFGVTSLPGDLGSVVISSANRVGISGIVEVSSIPAITQSTSPWVTSGTATIAGSAYVIGSIVISSANKIGVSGIVEVSNDVNLGTAWTNTGSVVISGTSIPTWRGVGSVTGNVGVSGVKLDNLAGSMGVTALPGILGSVYIKSGIVGVSGDYFQDMIGSVRSQSVQITSPWVTSGTSTVAGSVYTTGSINIATNLSSIGSWTGYTGSIWSMPTTTVTATNLDIRDLTKATDNVATSGTATVAGSVYTTGSINIVNEIIMQNVGSPCFKFSYLTASGTYSDTWKIGGAGSKLEIHGWHISSDNPGYVRIVVSGATPGKIAEYHLNYASGATVEKTFCTPIIPAGAGSAIGFGATVAGSTCVTIYGREVK